MYKGTHFIDHLKFLTGSDIEHVMTIGLGRYVTGRDGEENGNSVFKFRGGAFAPLLRGCSEDGPSLSSWLAVGIRGDFVSRIREGRQPSVNAHDGKASAEAAVAVIRSHEIGQPVRLPLS